MESKQLPADVQARICSDALDAAKGIGDENRKDSYYWGYIAGAMAEAEWEVKYDEERSERVHLGKENDLLTTKANELVAENEKLKTERDNLQAVYTALFNTAQTSAAKYQQLKERCEKMAKEHADLNLALAAMLNGYQNLSMYQKEWFTVPKDLIDTYTKMVLEYDNQGKEGESNTPAPGGQTSPWIKAEDRPLIKRDGEWWEFTEDGEKEFIAAVPYKDAGTNEPDKVRWWIRHCYIDGEGFLYVKRDNDMDEDVAGWSPFDITHWMPIPVNPEGSGENNYPNNNPH